MTWYEKLDKVIGDYLPDLPMERDVPMDRSHPSALVALPGGWPARRIGSSW